MSYISLLTENEIQYICSAIPVKDVSEYFQRYPKEFAKILPGFRATTISQYNIDIGILLFNNRNMSFVSSFIDTKIKIWLREIQDHLDQCKKNGDNKDIAYIQTLSQSFFAGNVALYFKLSEKKRPKTYISLLSSAVNHQKEFNNIQKQMYDDLQSKNTEIERLHTKLKSAERSLEKLNYKRRDQITEIKSLKQELANANKTTILLQEKEKTISDLKAEIFNLNTSKNELLAKLSEVQASQQQLESRIRDKLEKQQAEKNISQFFTTKPLRPIDMEEFKEFLGYNLENINVPVSSDYWLLLNQYLCDILFEGMPIIINRGTGVLLMKCVANALVGNKNVSSLTYNNNVSSDEIEVFLSKDSRVVCLNGFLGNYNETELLISLEGHRNKIVFLTLPFDRTLQYIPYEIFRYCRYLNLNRIQAFSKDPDLTEDPSIIDEVETDLPQAKPHPIYSTLLKNIIDELGLPQSITSFKIARVSDEQYLCGTLAFAVLPYCTDVLNISPFATSEHIIKYAGIRGRCPYKRLFKEWFVT